MFIRWPGSGVRLSVGQNFTAYVHHICARVCRRNFSAKPRRAEIPDTRYAIHIADIANERAYDHCNKLQRLLSAASAPGGRHLRLLLKIVQQENLKTMPPNPSQPATAPQTPGHRPKGHGNNWLINVAAKAANTTEDISLFPAVVRCPAGRLLLQETFRPKGNPKQRKAFWGEPFFMQVIEIYKPQWQGRLVYGRAAALVLTTWPCLFKSQYRF